MKTKPPDYGKDYCCKRCGKMFFQRRQASLICLSCRNIARAVKQDGRSGYYERIARETIFLSNGLEILNNAAGKEIAYGGRTCY